MPNDYSRERLQGSVSVDADIHQRRLQPRSRQPAKATSAGLSTRGWSKGKCVHLIAGGAGGDVHARRGRVPRVGGPHYRRG